MSRNIRVTGEKEEKVRALLKPAENDVRVRAFRYYGITRPLYSALFFAHMEGQDRIGFFDPESSIIVLSEALLDCPLSTVRNVFIHECAHAVDSIVNPVMTGHSAFFRDVCGKLGIDSGFEKARIKVELRTKEKAREKLDKLLALTSSSFENEAVIAMEKALSLIKKASLEDREEAEEEKIYSVDLCERKRIGTYIIYISNIIGESTGVFIVKNHMGGSVALTAYGSLEQCESALYLFDYLSSALDSEIIKLRKKGQKISKDSFMMGAWYAIKEKTEKNGDNALVVSLRNENGEKARRLVFKDTTLSSGRSRIHVDRLSFASGSSFGKDLDISGDKQKRIGH